jgi:hypothetical protein
MSDIAKFFKGQFAKLAAGAIDQKVDGREITRKMDAELDAQLGEKTSERIQRGPTWNLLKEMAEGLFDEDVSALRVELHNWMQDLGPDKKEGGK